MGFINALPKAITRVLRDFPFPSNIDKESIRKAVNCREDLLFATPDLDEQLQIAVTLALLNARFVNTSSLIVVRTSAEARKIYNILNPHQQNNFSSDDLTNETISPPIDKYAIRVASTFSKFKGNSYPSANDCIIITSYDNLLRNLLYRKSSVVELKNRVTLPLTNAYIFVDPFGENRSLRRATESFTTFDIDGILFFKRRMNNLNIRMHYISPGIVSLDEQKSMLNVTTTAKITGDHELDFSSYIDRHSIKENLRYVLPYSMLLRLYSGHPTKKQLTKRIQNSANYRLLQNTHESRTNPEFLQEILFEELFKSTYSSECLFELCQQSLGKFALVLRANGNSGKYTLTTFGKKFLIASTYFKEIQEDPIGVLLDIKNRTQNDIIDWNIISEIFHNFTDGRLAYNDLQILLGRLKTKKNDEEETIAKILSRTQDSYSVFKVYRLLVSFQDQMSPGAKKNFTLISKAIVQNLEILDEPLVGKKDRLAIEQAIKEELEYATQPLTRTQIALNLSLLNSDVELALDNLEKNSSLSLNTITVKPPIGRSVTYYSTKEIPKHFFEKCGNCYPFQ